MSLLKRFLPVVLVVALVAVGAVVMLSSGNGQKTATAYFPRTVSIYEGSEVRVLGVPVGTIDEVTPEGTQVKVVMSYESEQEIPASAKAVIISPAIVGDRYVQLTPAYEGGPELPDNAVLNQDRTAVPLELDEIFGSLDKMVVALGPTGANRNGALTDLLETTAANFGGQGATFKQTISDYAKLSKTLDVNKEELFGSLGELEGFIHTLADNDEIVRAFNQSLGRISTMLAGERQELAAALGNLRVALGEVGTFVKQNRKALGTNIKGLNKVAATLVRRRGDLDQLLRIAPVGLNNLGLAGNPDTATLDFNANLAMNIEGLLKNPASSLCAILGSDKTLCSLLGALGRTAPSGSADGGARGGGPVTSYDRSFGGLVEVED